MVILIPDESQYDYVGFDVTTNESHRLETTPAQSPLENGAPITGHTVKLPSPFTCDVFVSNNPTHGTFYEGAVYASKKAVVPALGPEDAPVEFYAFQIAREANRVAEMWERLKDLRDNDVTMTIVTSIEEKEVMLLTLIELIRPEKSIGGGWFHLEFTPLFFVSTQTVNAPQPKEPRGAPSAAKGAQAGAGKSLDDVLGKQPGESYARAVGRLGIGGSINAIAGGFLGG